MEVRVAPRTRAQKVASWNSGGEREADRVPVESASQMIRWATAWQSSPANIHARGAWSMRDKQRPTTSRDDRIRARRRRQGGRHACPPQPRSSSPGSGCLHALRHGAQARVRQQPAQRTTPSPRRHAQGSKQR